MVKMRWTFRSPHVVTASLMVILLAGLVQLACVQDFWVDVSPLHPGDMAPAELEIWQAELARINEALEGINDEHEYKRKEYECDSFSDYTAQELAKECFTVKRAMSYTFEYPDGRTGVHHWLFIVVKAHDTEVWVPVECTPPNGETQKQYESDCCDAPDGQCPTIRIEQLPRIAYEGCGYLATVDPAPDRRFEERYFGSTIIWDVAAAQECRGGMFVGSGACPGSKSAIVAR